MNYSSPYLQPYKGKHTRFQCPACKRLQCFTRYIDGNTHLPIHETVGRCNREIKCGYHYSPKQYFLDYPNYMNETSGISKCHIGELSSTRKGLPQSYERGGFIKHILFNTVPFDYITQSISINSNFILFLKKYFHENEIKNVCEKYLLGATKTNEVIFWQLDTKGRVRTGKIMQYNPETGKRLKSEIGSINWVHCKLKKKKLIPEDFILQQCFFGEHLLAIYPDTPVAIVESEKTAIIASLIVPDVIWLAAGNINGLTIEKSGVLKNRTVTIFPDLGAFQKWSLKVTEITKQINCKISVSKLLENNASSEAMSRGLDVADFIISKVL